jgi:uncharacterized membrane protein
MVNRNGPVIDMTIDGNIVEPARPSLGTIVARLAVFGVALLVVAVAFWTALFMVPVLLVAGAIGYFALRSQLRRNGVVVFRRRF